MPDASIAAADSLELKNGSLIKGKFMGGTESEITFQVGSSVQKYNLADVVSLKFDSERSASDMPTRPKSSVPSQPGSVEQASVKSPAYVTVPAGMRISVRTIDAIDSTKNHVGDQPLVVDGHVVVDKGADGYGQLAESKQSGTFTGRSQLRLELTGIVVNGRTVPVAAGEYELTGKSRGASTAKRTVGGAAVGSIIGALSRRGQGSGDRRGCRWGWLGRKQSRRETR